MYQMIEVKDMNIEEAVALCKREYVEEMQKAQIMRKRLISGWIPSIH